MRTASVNCILNQQDAQIHGWIELTSRSAPYSGTFNIKAPSTRAQSEVYGTSSISPGFSAFMKGTPHSQASRLKKLSM